MKLPLEIHNEIKNIINNHEIGEFKKGDLKAMRVHRFKFKAQLYLVRPEINVRFVQFLSEGVFLMV